MYDDDDDYPDHGQMGSDDDDDKCDSRGVPTCGPWGN